MKGYNEIRLCPSEMEVAMQEWLDKYVPKNDSNVTEVRLCDGVFIICINNETE